MKKKANGEGSIYRRKVDGMYVGSITVEDGKRKYFYSKKRQEVAEKMNAALLEKRHGTLVTSSQQTLGQYLPHWLEHSVRGAVRLRTFERYEEVVRLHLVPVVGKIRLQALKPQHVQSLKSKKLKEGLSTTTVALIQGVLHKALDDAVKHELLARNVCDLVSPPREESAEINPLDLDQIARLLIAAKGHPLETLLVLALATGMRRGELLGLKWHDIDFGKGVLQVRRILSRLPTEIARERGYPYVEAEPKTKSSRRSIALAGFAVDALRKHRALQEKMRRSVGELWEDHDYVFTNALGKHLSPGSGVLVPFKKLLKKAGLPDVRFHDLRHSAATWLLSMGIHPKVVQEILGHTKISMTMDIYSHVLPTMQQGAMETLNQSFEGFSLTDEDYQGMV
jgi:integrase